jgi:hypothetical protein
MKHLTIASVQHLAEQAARGRMPPESLPAHLSSCADCMQEFKLQRALVEALGKPAHSAPGSIKRAVMGQIAAPGRHSAFMRALSAGGRAVAMACVLGVIVYALTLDVPGSPQPGPASELFGQISSYYFSAKEFLAGRSSVVNQVADRDADGYRILVITFLVLAGLGLVDRFVIRHFVRMKL